MIFFKLFKTYPQSLLTSVRMAERSKAPDSSNAYTTTWTECSGLHLEAWVRIPLLTHFFSLIKSENPMCSLGTNIVSHQRVSERCINLIRLLIAMKRPHKNRFRLKCSARWRSSSYLRRGPPLTARLQLFSNFPYKTLLKIVIIVLYWVFRESHMTGLLFFVIVQSESICVAVQEARWALSPGHKNLLRKMVYHQIHQCICK